MSNHPNRKRPTLYQSADMKEALRTIASYGVPPENIKQFVYGMIKETSPEGPARWLPSIERAIDEIFRA